MRTETQPGNWKCTRCGARSAESCALAGCYEFEREPAVRRSCPPCDDCGEEMYRSDCGVRPCRCERRWGLLALLLIAAAVALAYSWPLSPGLP